MHIVTFISFPFPFAPNLTKKGTKIDSQNTKEKMVIISLYVAIGLSVFAMCFKLMQEEVVDKVKWLATKVGILKSNVGKEKTEKSL